MSIDPAPRLGELSLSLMLRGSFQHQQSWHCSTRKPNYSFILAITCRLSLVLVLRLLPPRAFADSFHSMYRPWCYLVNGYRKPGRVKKVNGFFLNSLDNEAELTACSVRILDYAETFVLFRNFGDAGRGHTTFCSEGAKRNGKRLIVRRNRCD